MPISVLLHGFQRPIAMIVRSVIYGTNFSACGEEAKTLPRRGSCTTKCYRMIDWLILVQDYPPGRLHHLVLEDVTITKRCRPPLRELIQVPEYIFILNQSTMQIHQSGELYSQ